MPENYKRRRHKKKRPARRKPRRYQVADYAYKGYKMAKRLMDAINIEYKMHDVVLTTTDCDYSGDIITLNSISQGDTDSTRDGDSCKLQNLTIRYFVKHTSNAIVRVIIYWDPDNSIAAASELLDSTGSSLAPLSFKDYDNRFKTRIIYDRKHILTAGGGLLQAVDKVIPINLHTQFDAGSSSVNSGALKMCVVSTEAPASNVNLTGHAHLTYTDS